MNHIIVHPFKELERGSSAELLLFVVEALEIRVN
jgi:hypothetical protein